MNTNAGNNRQASQGIEWTGVKLFLAIAARWNLTNDESCTLAGVQSRSTLGQWRQSVEKREPITISPETLERLSYIAGIADALYLLFTTPEQEAAWLRRSTSIFEGPALGRMLEGSVEGLSDVKRYLQAWTSEHY